MKGTRPEANLTGGQIQQVLDKMIYDSIYLILPFGSLDQVLITILSSLVLDKRRKISSIDHTNGINLLCDLVSKSSEDAFTDLKNLKIERTVYLKILNSLVAKVESSNYVPLYYDWLMTKSKSLDRLLLSIENDIGISREKLLSVYQNIACNLSEFNTFKSSILSQFINLAHKYTSTQIKNKNKNISYDDLFQNIVAAISKALDKYDSSKGALTSYVKYWIINAQNQDNSHIDGLAYEITYNQRQKLARKEVNEANFSTSLSDTSELYDDSSPELIVEERDSLNRIIKLIKVADPTGIFRLINNIEEYITKDEIALMKRHMERELRKKNLKLA